MNYLDKLNPSQKSAVENTEGPVMIIAGAGSGKTRVITYRIAHLLNKGVDPFNILSLTFTNKAAKEMKERIAEIVGNKEARNLWMGTFHSVFAKILRTEAEKIGYPSNFTIYDTDDSKSLIKTLLKEEGLDEKIYKPALVYNRISSAKNSLIGWAKYSNDTDLQAEDRMSAKPKIGLLYEKYQKRCFNAGAMDFDDLLYNTNVLLRDFPEILNKYQHKFKYIMVDEYQDTNFSQYVIVKKLAAAHENICVVGDDAQSIYAFRGANIQNILNFKSDYPELKVFKLEQNYRSTKNIVQAANSVIANNKQQLEKSVWTDNETGERIKIIKAISDNEEGQKIADSIFQTKMNLQLHNKDFAILYRTNAQSRAMEEALRRMNIEYKIYGGLSFYKRKEIKDLLAYFRLTINPQDEEALKRVINYPARGIGNTTLDKLFLAAGTHNVGIWTVLDNLGYYNLGINSGITNKIIEFVTMVKSFATMLKTQNAFDLANHISQHSGVLKDLYVDKTPEGVSRYENIQELLNGIKEFAEKIQTEEDFSNTLDVFMQDIALLTDVDENNENNGNNQVSLMTIHSSKGLEFPYVYIVGMEENLFPSQLSLNSRVDLEEERRLFYVALTRAEKKLTLSFALTRYRWGNLIHCEPSRFLEELDADLVDAPETPTKSIEFYDSPASREFDFYEKKKVNTNPAPKQQTFPPAPPKRNFVKLNSIASTPTTGDFSGDDTSMLKEGIIVEHQRFGTGTVVKIEGAAPNQKATVNFNGIGEKMLILKFAKLKILD